jgi:CAAX prenyl protease-like protein
MRVHGFAHGWLPYWIPYCGFLLIVQFGAVTPYLLPLRVVVPLGFLLYFARRGKYPELSGFRWDTRIALDVLVGVGSAAIWITPFLLVPTLRPAPETVFDPHAFGASLAWLTWLFRLTGFAVVTPFMEELFVRSWLQRFVESIGRQGTDFLDLPIAQVTLRSFLVVVLWFVFSHARHEWPVAAVWIVVTQIWFYHRKHLVPMVVTHAASNFSIFLFVVFANGKMRDALGNTISLWFFL